MRQLLSVSRTAAFRTPIQDSGFSTHAPVLRPNLLHRVAETTMWAFVWRFPFCPAQVCSDVRDAVSDVIPGLSGT